MKKRVLSIALAASICAGLVPTAAATEPKETAISVQKVSNEELPLVLPAEREVTGAVSGSDYADGDRVRVSVVLEGAPAIRQVSEAADFTDDAQAVAYRETLEQMQLDAAEEISTVIGEKLQVVWNLTLAANIISAEVDYGDIEAIKSIDGVSDVFVETQYDPCTAETAEPNMMTSGAMIGSGAAWAAGYTGAGSLVAVIDTGTDTTHQSFDAGAFDYAIEQTGKEVDLLDVEDIAGKLTQLNAYQQNSSLTAEQLYRTSKLPYAYNYVDEDLNVTHLDDTNGEHGSHVAGIATANRYIPDGEGGYVDALTTVYVQGVAPDAQLITMKVFGKNGGAYDSDYMAAIEDAIVLGADSINLSLGSNNAGESYSTTYQELLDGLTAQGAVVNISAGNNGPWQEKTAMGVLYSDDVNMQTDGSPGSYTNVFTVASVDNVGETTQKLTFSGVDSAVPFTESGESGNKPIATLDTNGNGTEYGFVLFENPGVTEAGESLLADYADVIRGKVVLVRRGESNFWEKHTAAAKADAVACIVVNNEPGSFGMDLSKTKETIPCISISQEDGNAIRAGATAVCGGADGGVLYYTGTVTIDRRVISSSGAKIYTMSDYSSWGVPGSLELKPEITAPGGGIYSVFGTNRTENDTIAGGSDQYENMSGTSMASPQVSGMAAVFAQFYRENGLAEKTGISQRKLFQSLLMSTATPLVEQDSGSYYSVMSQGAGLANVNDAINAHSYLTMDESANAGAADGKVKVELGDDPAKAGVYTFDYTIHNLLDEDAYYELETDVFTQDVFTYSGIDFLDTSTAALENAVVTYQIDGTTLDDPGVYTELNAQLVLNALAEGTSGGLTDKYDLDGDDKITSYDVHLILAGAEETEAVCVPANGSVTVTVTLDVTGCDLSAYPNGAYIQAYSYAKEHATAEGLAGTLHSIPVLGFYGNWSDASMFDVGTMVEYYHGMERRVPYLYEATECATNFLSVKYTGSNKEYYFLGNPVAKDSTYLEERNALNSDNMIFAAYYTLIRNAEASRLQITDVNDKTVYYDSGDSGQQYAAYCRGQVWKNTQAGRYIKWRGTDAEGNKLPEGTEVEISLTMAPEYYVSYERKNGTLQKKVDWDALGEGTRLTTRITIDNTPPEVMSVSYNEAENQLSVVAKNGQYLAQVALYKRGATETVGAVTPNQTEKGTEFTATFDVSKLSAGDELYVQVIDYAMNISTYKMTLGGSGDKQAPTAITISPETLTLYKDASAQLELSFTPWVTDERVTWTSSDPAVATVTNGVVTALEEGSTTITATSVADPAVSAVCEVTVQRRDVTLLGVLQDENSDIRLFSWNMKTQDTWTPGQRLSLPEERDLISATYAPAGADTAIYLMDDDNNFYQIDPATGEIQMESSTVFAYPVDDMDYGFISSALLGCDILYGVYGSYVLISAPEDPSIRYGLDLSDHLGNANFVTIAYGGYLQNTAGNLVDLFYCLTTAGEIYSMQVDLYNGKASGGIIKTDLDLDLRNYNCSMLVGDDGALYLSYYNIEEDASEIYLLEYDKGAKKYVSTKLGSLGEDVWPGALLMVTKNGGGVQAAALDEESVTAFPEVELKPLTLQKMDTLSAQNRRDGGLTATVEAGGTSAATEGRKTVSLKIFVDTVTNGLVELDYDDTALTFVRATGMEGALSSAYGENGALLVAYAAKEAVSGEITLTFSYDSVTCPTSTSLQATTMEENSVLTPSETTELTLTLREPSSGGGGGGSSVITVPVTSDGGSVNVQVTVSDGTAAVKVSEKQLEKIIADGGTDVTVDVSGLKKVDSAKLPTATVNKLTEAGNVDLTVTLASGAVTLDSTALARLGGGADVTVSVAAVAEEKLTDSQKAALDGTSAVAVVDVDILSGGTKISDFNGGKLTIAIPYTPKEGEDINSLTVWFVREDGTVENLGGWYDAERGCFLFETGHLSRYLLVNAEKTPEFSDVAPEAWYADAVLWAVESGITNGVGESLFAPERVCTRGEIVTLLWRGAGAPKVAQTETSFADVSEDAFCYDAVAWAVENGITNGVGESLFAPERVCTRGEIVTLLWRGAGAPKAAQTETSFTDVSEDTFCYDAVLWAVENGITDGIGDSLFGAGNFCTRAEVVTLLYRYYEN